MSTTFWTDEKIATLAELAPVCSMAAAADKMGISKAAVRYAAEIYLISFEKHSNAQPAEVRERQVAWRNAWRARHAASGLTVEGSERVRGLFEWTPSRIENLRDMGRHLSIQGAAAALGITAGMVRSAMRKHRISFAKPTMTPEQLLENSRAADRARRPLKGRNHYRVWDQEKIEHVRELAKTMNSRQLAEELDTNRNKLAGICNRYKIKPQQIIWMTPEERAERERQRNRKSRVPVVRQEWNRSKKTPKVSRFKLLTGYAEYRPAVGDLRIVEAEKAERRSEAARRETTMDVCKLFASGQIDRAEMSRRLAQSQSQRAA